MELQESDRTLGTKQQQYSSQTLSVHPLNCAKITTGDQLVSLYSFHFTDEKLKTIAWSIAVLIRQEPESNSGHFLLYHMERLKTRSY